MKKHIANRQDAARAPGSWAWSRTALALAGLGLLGLLGGCASQGPEYAEGSSEPRFDSPDSIPDAVPRVEPKSKYGNMESYVVRGRRYYTKDSSLGHVERGLASWYGPGFHKRKTSSGERYDMYSMTAAHKTLPLPTYARVTNLENGRSAVVKINDRGPFHGPRVIDLSFAAATKLGVLQQGTAMVEVRAIDPARPSSDPGPFLAANAPRSPRPASVFDDELAFSGPTKVSESRPASRPQPAETAPALAAQKPAEIRPEPVLASREPAELSKPAVSPDPAAEMRAQEAARERAFKAALAALDAQAERDREQERMAAAAAEAKLAPKIVDADSPDRREAAAELKSESPKIAAAEKKNARAAAGSAKGREAPKVAAAAKKESATPTASGKQDIAKAASAKGGGAKVAAAGKGGSSKVAAADKKDAAKVATADKKGGAKVAVADSKSGSNGSGSGQGVYLQVGAFGDRGNAERLRKKLSPHLAGQVRVQNPSGSGSSLYKVRIGPFDSEGEARKVSAKLASLGLEQPRRVVN